MKMTIEYDEMKESITTLKINEVNILHKLLAKEIKNNKDSKLKKKLIWIDNQFDSTQ